MEILQHIIEFILHIDKHLADIIHDYNSTTYFILFAIIFAETGFVVTPFLPGDSLLFAAGAIISANPNTGMNIYLLALLLIVAAFAGNTVNYLLGAWLGDKVFKPGNRILKLEYYHQTNAFFEKHGGKAVILSRFVPIIRTVAPFVAGVGRMPFGRYSLYNIIGGVAWVVIFLFAGKFLGGLEFFKKHFSLVSLGIILVSVIPAVVAAINSRKKKTVA
ncbi:DedA family protein [Mucilaginibacter myungsuensis]|uniref:DedA family protein n=1 Tax=Mucilaginibacter myungsuensis TaxID=649104 RepID=A0A929KZR0_9SPHI|nr:DedA family protein [Mucilaginibacter myungsuensis]MBE9664182.1 DedA family protein [Mucilaginibacter myungsuensis]MDN3599885.1 DedA family protein [Mucilaginibacter myungsuensis]